jgi:hypothetical protein
MSEQDPSLTLNMGDGKKLELTPDNTTIYTFLGRTALGDMQFENESANHAFVQTGRNEKDVPQGMYFFEQFHPVYKDIAAFAMEHCFPQLLNVRRVPECDLKAYHGEIDRQEARFHAQLEGALPEDF